MIIWLKHSDMTAFSRLHHLGKLACVASDVEVQSELSVKDIQKSLSPKRYRHMLLAKLAFWDAEKGPLALLRNFFCSPRYRRKFLHEAMKQHLDPFRADLHPRQPKVSICMASYNSGGYIDLQLKSILPQLKPEDEVVIIDDHSTDGTPDRIRALADPRIRLIQHTENVGVTASFEQALRAATGDLLFLSDHDDIWAPDKVQLFCEAFGKGPQVQLVMSAVSLIDADGKPFRNKRLDRNGKFRRGFLRNVIKNGYQGSSLAIRSSLLGPLLPFPKDRTYLHDAWIGTLNDRLHGDMVFLEKPLLLYRRHATNVSQRLTLWERVLSRTQLLLDHLWHAIHGRGLKRPVYAQRSRPADRHPPA